MHPASRDALLEKLNKVTLPPDVNTSTAHDESSDDEEDWQDASEALPFEDGTEQPAASSPSLDIKAKEEELEVCIVSVIPPSRIE